MKAIYLDQKGGFEELRLGDIPRPSPVAGEVLVKVHATAITPMEFQWYPTFNTRSGDPRPFPIVLSHELSGEIDSISAKEEMWQVGDEVFGLNDWFVNGAQAEYCLAPSTALARKPRCLDHVQASVVPISALTAWQGLLEKADLRSDERVLIHGAAGGVGVFAVQLAHWRGAKVTATASSTNLDFVRALGAETVIDYRATRFENEVRDVDVLFDCVGGEMLERSFGVLKPGARVVTIASQSANSTVPRIRDAFILVRADGSQLAQIGNLIDAGELRVFVEDDFPFSKAREAYARAQHGKMRGKIALRVLE